MKKGIARIILGVTLVTMLSGCVYTEEDLENARLEGYQQGYEHGYANGSAMDFREVLDEYRKTVPASTESTSGTGSEKADSILAKYGIAQVRGSENNSGSTAGSNGSADSFIEKYLGPSSGTILSGKEYPDGSEITVTADFGSDYVVLLKGPSGKEKVSFYVRAGDTVTVGVPAEYLYVYFASGTAWYGYGEGLMFGENTVYSKDDNLQDFTQYTWEYTLYPVSDGNFSETPSDEDEFFE